MCIRDRLGIAVAEGVSSPVAPAELTWALVMAAMRRLPQYIGNLKHGAWQQSGLKTASMPPNFPLGLPLSGETLGIWGSGKIGPLGAGFGVRSRAAGEGRGGAVLCGGGGGGARATPPHRRGRGRGGGAPGPMGGRRWGILGCGGRAFAIDFDGAARIGLGAGTGIGTGFGLRADRAGDVGHGLAAAEARGQNRRHGRGGEKPGKTGGLTHGT